MNKKWNPLDREYWDKQYINTEGSLIGTIFYMIVLLVLLFGLTQILFYGM